MTTTLTMLKKRYGLMVLSMLCLFSCDNFPDPSPANYELFVGSQDKYPKFSNDGEFIAYYHYDDPGDEPDEYPSGLYIIDKNGANRKLVIEGHYHNPDWSPDDNWLVFSALGSIQKCKINGDSLTTLDQGPYQHYYFQGDLFFPDWSPDGQYILFDKAYSVEGISSLYSMESDFTNVQPFFGNVVIASRDPELSPVSDEIVYWQAFHRVPYQIYTMNQDGTEKKNLTNNNKDNRAPTWSPDGSRIAWSANVLIHIMDKDGSNPRRLVYGSYPSWSKHNEIVYSHANEDYSKEVLYVIGPDGRNKRQITF